MDAGGLSREWMALLMRSVFTNEGDPVDSRTEERFVMRIDHLSPRNEEQENIKYYKDISMNHRSITFSYTPNGYLPNPAFNYSQAEINDNEVPKCASEPFSQNYQFVGRLIGRAVFDGIPLGIHLNPLM